MLRQLRGQLFRASRLLDQPDNPWRRRRLLDSLTPRAGRIGSGAAAILCLKIRVPYRAPQPDGVVLLPGGTALRPADLQAVGQLSRQAAFARCPIHRIAVIDTETTGLLDKPDTVPFLIGLGRFGSRAFHVEQYFLEYLEGEPDFVRLLARRMRDFRALITYNGTAFDLPLLRRRFALQRLSESAWRLPHWDVLPTARRLWKSRSRSCSLVNLEQSLLGFERRRDIESNRIPQVYRDYLGDRRAERLAAVFDHNAQDILTTAALAVASARLARKDPSLIA